MYRALCIITALFISLSGCQDDPLKPDDLIQEPLYIDLLTDLFFHDSMVEMRNLDHKADSLRKVLFHHYEVSADQFERTHEYYQRQPADQIARLDTMRSMMQTERDSLEERRRELREAERRAREEREALEREEQEEPPEHAEPELSGAEESDSVETKELEAQS